jgi:O-antigen/teichoic acid export membrane protein
VYFFAWQLITQSATLISGSLMAVLLPALARMRHEPARRRRVTQRAVRGLVITAAPVCLAAAVTFAPAEELLWDEKWRAAVVPFILLAVAFPFRLTVPISRASLMAGGRFRAHAALLAVNGLGLMLCAAFAGSATDDVNLITAAVAGYLVLASLISLAYATHELDLGWADLLRAVTPAWALCVALALPLIALDRLALDGQPPLLRIVGLGLTFVLAVGIAYRHFLAADLTDILAVVPPPVARRARRVLFLSRS